MTIGLDSQTDSNVRIFGTPNIDLSVIDLVQFGKRKIGLQWHHCTKAAEAGSGEKGKLCPRVGKGYQRTSILPLTSVTSSYNHQSDH
jgi:hypothetical protein